MTQEFGTVAMIGLGLINGSLALALRNKGVVGRINGFARKDETRRRALELGIVDAVFETASDAVADADIIVIGTPPGAMGDVAASIRTAIKPGAIITDVGSVKMSVIEAVKPHVPDHAVFVPGHPVAGTEHSGPDAAFATLFANRRIVLTPEDGAVSPEVSRITAMWEATGALVDVMTPAHHDKILAITSHLPHLIAYTIVGTVADLEDQDQTEVFKFAAGGFTDFTRIAGSDPTMWRDVFLNNKEAVLEMLGRFSEDLSALQRAIRWGEGDKLFDLFSRTRSIRQGVIEAGQAYVRQPEDPLADKV